MWGSLESCGLAPHFVLLYFFVIFLYFCSHQCFCTSVQMALMHSLFGCCTGSDGLASLCQTHLDCSHPDQCHKKTNSTALYTTHNHQLYTTHNQHGQRSCAHAYLTLYSLSLLSLSIFSLSFNLCTHSYCSFKFRGEAQRKNTISRVAGEEGVLSICGYV